MVKMKDKELGVTARRKGRLLEFKINVLLDITTALKTFRAVHEMEKRFYESRVKPSDDESGIRK